MRSNGWKKGFSIVSESSAFEDEELIVALRDRVARLYQILSLKENPPRENIDGGTLAENTLRVKLEKAEGRIAELEDSVEEIEDRDEQLLSTINEALGEIYSEEFSDLGSAITALLMEYNDAVEEAEDRA